MLKVVDVLNGNLWLDRLNRYFEGAVDSVRMSHLCHMKKSLKVEDAVAAMIRSGDIVLDGKKVTLAWL